MAKHKRKKKPVTPVTPVTQPVQLKPGAKGAKPKKSVGRRLWEFVRSWGTVILIVLAIRAFVIEAFTVPTGSMETTILPGDFLLVNKFVYGFKAPFTNAGIISGRMPRRGEIIVFRYPRDPRWPEPEERYTRFFPKWFPLLPIFWDRELKKFHWYSPRNYVKRCVGLPGDTIEIINKRVYVNGEPFDNPHAVHMDRRLIPRMVEYEGFNERWQSFEFEGHYEVRDNFGPIIVPQGYVFGMGDNRDFSDDCRYWGPIPIRFLKGSPVVIYYSLGEGSNILERIVRTKWKRIGKVVR
ncbi:MAG: signal peptidase I [candidate division WOR-3 bacterium]|nr:signal peptidase I [candidate division WOR-3 bacterium]